MAMKTKATLAALVVSTALAGAQDAKSTNHIAGKSFNLTNTESAHNGSWCWFEGERAVVDSENPDGPLLLAGTVSFTPGAKGPEAGDIDLLWRNLKTGEQGTFELHDRLAQDDHNSPALWIRPDGRYIAMYAKHGSDPYSRYRISEAHDPTSWSDEKTIKTGKAGITYSNLYAVGGEKNPTLLNFRRGYNVNPNVCLSEDSGETWKRIGLLVKEGKKGRTRPYVRYIGDGGHQVHLVLTDGHPRDVNTGLWHAEVSLGDSGKLQLSSSTDDVIDSDLSDDDPRSPADLTQILAPGTVLDGVKVDHAWPCDLSLSPAGNPQALMTVRVEKSQEDHRFVYAIFDGQKWHNELLAKAGSYLYKKEGDYTGLGAVHPHKAGHVVISTPVDPRNGEKTDFYEIYTGTRGEGGQWTWKALTENSTMQNLRPEIPAWDSAKTLVLWGRGDFQTYLAQDLKMHGTLLDW